MKLKTWLGIHAGLGLIFGTLLILAPGALMSASGVNVDNVSLIFARGVGGAILGISYINWVGRNYVTSPLIWSVVVANIILHLVAGIADLNATLNHTYTANGWGSTIFHFVLVAIFGYFFLVKPKKVK